MDGIIGTAGQKDASENDSVLDAHVISLRLMFSAWMSHFRSLGYIKETTMDMLDRTVCKQSVERSVKDPKVRDAIGSTGKVWTDLVELVRIAIPSLESRSFALPNPDPHGHVYEGPSSNVIVANSITLLRDLQRLDSMFSMARNVLTCGEKVQNMAAQVGFDREVCAMVNLCIKITARGYDGDGTTVEEDKWQGVINGFKKLLITCLQFLSNLVTLNERLKLMLWVELFDSSNDFGDRNGFNNRAAELDRTGESWMVSATNAFAPPLQSLRSHAQSAPINSNTGDAVAAALERGDEATVEAALDRAAADSALAAASAGMENRVPTARPMNPPTPYFAFITANRERIREQLSLKSEPTTKQLVEEATKRWNSMAEREKDAWRRDYEERVLIYRNNLKVWEAAGSPEGPRKQSSADSELEFEAPESYTPRPASPSSVAATAEKLDRLRLREANHTSAPSPSVPLAAADRLRPYTANPDLFAPPLLDFDYRNMESAADGARKLAIGKEQLIKRLFDNQPEPELASPIASPISPIISPASPVEELEDGDPEDELDEEEESEEDESSEDDYAVPGEDGRGLLTDVPLILGPNEIEVLPMIIMSGIVAPAVETEQAKKDTSDPNALINMYTIRCHLLLAQENGRNLLRELLIFVAAWDLREEELYFKFMVKIMEAILMNGLMPFAYGAFKESKDIISPAQAVIMKLLTKIFHTRQGFIAPRSLSSIGAASGHGRPLHAAQQPPPPQQPPLRLDIQIVHCLFSEFRTSIIPQICALIFLQGQIKRGHANLEDFPLNLWDMERMYEGVYQYLEFFAILTDHDAWKGMMADWEVVSELVTLLRELEDAIPKGRLSGNPPTQHHSARHTAAPQPNHGPMHTAPAPVPFPTSAEASQSPSIAPVAVERPYDVASPPPIPRSTSSAPAPITAPLPAPPAPYAPEPLHDEPAHFEWRNLKKLCVLVLSSLVWKNKRLQDQVRSFGGIMAVLSCCAFDEHNPYIREHAIMCLRFLLEGNQDNQDVVRGLQQRSAHAASSSAPSSAAHAAGAEGGAQARSGGPVPAESGGNGNGGNASMNTSINPPVAVPKEVLDHHGYETFMDAKGQVGLRRKDTVVAPIAHTRESLRARGGAVGGERLVSGGGGGGGEDGVGGVRGAHLPEWMSMVMKNMPR